LATAPGGFVRSVAAPTAVADRHAYQVVIPGVLEADADRVRVELGDDASTDLLLKPTSPWPLRLGGGGIFSTVPFLGQYWHPHVLDGTAEGSVRAGDTSWTLDGAQLYAEKNWGRGFPEFWWWGQAHGFERRDVTVAFGGGVLQAGPLAPVVGGIVVRVGSRVIRLTPPLARIAVDVTPGRWQLSGKRRGVEVHLSGRGAPGEAHVLPVPVPAERRNVPSDFEHLTGELAVVVRDRGAVMYAGSSSLAGLEVGFRPGHPALESGSLDQVHIRSGPRRRR
jgi:tocopherol cyclase